MIKNANSQENLTILLLGTGGTIAGLGGDAYRAAQLPIDALVPVSKHRIVSEQLAQIDSKDMSFEIWEHLYVRLVAAQNDVAIDAIVITHGTDTLEETAYFLYRTLSCTKPVILTGAMRAADSADSDGPHNLSDALARANQLDAGVWVAFAGKIFSGGNVRKVHPTQLDAFDVINPIERNDAVQALPHLALPLPIKRWPRVEIVMSYAGASGEWVEALIQQKTNGKMLDGIVVAGTGNSTVHHELGAALDKARAAGVAVYVATRCAQSGLSLSPLRARIDLLLRLLTTVTS
ncbi:MAG: asparaginase [Cytophagales bacterium]|nr:asparaginase [Cytophagales bacterium]